MVAIYTFLNIFKKVAKKIQSDDDANPKRSKNGSR